MQKPQKAGVGIGPQMVKIMLPARFELAAFGFLFFEQSLLDEI
jgi:hypothetical protein